MSVPSTYKKIVINKLSANFREVSQVVTVPTPKPAKGQVLVRNVYAGINASDINYSAGKYSPDHKPPMDAGFEAIGVVVAVGPDVTRTKVGDNVALTAYGAFAEYQVVHEKMVIPIPMIAPQVLPLLVSGLTASIALEQVGEIKRGQTVLVTAAAGGTGVFAVQLAKLAGCHVIGTCSSSDKVSLLKSLGCDRVVNYKTESLQDILKKEYPKGIDCVYESVGGEMFQIAAKHLAIHGKLIVIGFVSGYADQTGWKGGNANAHKPAGPPLPVLILGKSASIRGFFLNNFTHLWKSHLTKLVTLVQQGKLQSVVDPKSSSFIGVSACVDAIEYLYSGSSVGKIVVQLHDKEQQYPIKAKL